jgi:hypothetical protein
MAVRIAVRNVNCGPLCETTESDGCGSSMQLWPTLWIAGYCTFSVTVPVEVVVPEVPVTVMV